MKPMPTHGTDMAMAIDPRFVGALSSWRETATSWRSSANPKAGTGYGTAGSDRYVTRSGPIAVMEISGVITQSETWWGTSLNQATPEFDAAVNDPLIESIILAIDSPGGSVFGVSEFADRVFAATKIKPIVAVAAPMALSAAYWIGASASKLYVQPSGEVGSIGVIVVHWDMSKAYEQYGINVTTLKTSQYKDEWADHSPPSQDAKDAMQETLQTYHDMFTAAVARGRGTKPSDVDANFGRGRAVMAVDAKKSGMVDGLMSFDSVVNMMRSASASKSLTRAKQKIASAREFLLDR